MLNIEQIILHSSYEEEEMSSSSTNAAAAAAAEELVGLRFNPTDEELLSHYLKNKMQGKDSRFPEIECCKHEPCDLSARLVPTQDMEWFFYSPRVYKYANSKRSTRATVQGYWKIQGKPRGIRGLSNAVIGNKRILTFYEGRGANSSKTNYIMHEYDLAETELGSMPRQNGDFVLCRLKINPDKSHKKKGSSICDEAELDSYIASNVENQAAADDMIAEQEENLASKELQDLLFLNGNVDECKESQKDSCLIDENDITTCNEGVFSDFEMQQVFAQLESLLYPTEPQQQQDYCSSTLQSPKEAKRGNVPHAGVNNNHVPVSNTASNFGTATDVIIREVFTQPGENLDPLFETLNLEPLFDPLLLDSPPPMHTEPRDGLHGNNYIVGNESQSQFGDDDFSLRVPIY